MLHYSTGVTIATSLFTRAARTVEHAPLYKRTLGNQSPDNTQLELPDWTLLVVLANLVVFLPLLIIVSTVESTCIM